MNNQSKKLYYVAQKIAQRVDFTTGTKELSHQWEAVTDILLESGYWHERPQGVEAVRDTYVKNYSVSEEDFDIDADPLAYVSEYGVYLYQVIAVLEGLSLPVSLPKPYEHDNSRAA